MLAALQAHRVLTWRRVLSEQLKLYQAFILTFFKP